VYGEEGEQKQIPRGNDRKKGKDCGIEKGKDCDIEGEGGSIRTI
jgi:hypothetical protein